MYCQIVSWRALVKQGKGYELSFTTNPTAPITTNPTPTAWLICVTKLTPKLEGIPRRDMVRIVPLLKESKALLVRGITNLQKLALVWPEEKGISKFLIGQRYWKMSQAYFWHLSMNCIPSTQLVSTRNLLGRELWDWETIWAQDCGSVFNSLTYRWKIPEGCWRVLVLDPWWLILFVLCGWRRRG